MNAALAPPLPSTDENDTRAQPKATCSEATRAWYDQALSSLEVATSKLNPISTHKCACEERGKTKLVLESDIMFNTSASLAVQ